MPNHVLMNLLRSTKAMNIIPEGLLDMATRIGPTLNYLNNVCS